MITIRNAALEDAAQILEIYDYYVKNTAISFEYETPTLQELQGRMERTMQRYPYLVAEEDGRIVGYTYAGPFVGRAAYAWSCEMSIYLAPQARKRGLGRMLYGAMEEALRNMGVLNLYACIAYPEEDDQYVTKNSADFNGHLGFTRAGRFHKCGYKFGRWYDMVWMEKVIASHGADQPPVQKYSYEENR